MDSINNVVLVGRLARPVELRRTRNDVAVANFTLAVDRNYRNSNGEQTTDFINCVIWRQSAENFARFTRKGSLVGIEGSIQTRNYENSNGQRVYVTEVSVDNFSLLEPKEVTNRRPENPTTNNGGGYNNQPQDPFADDNDEFQDFGAGAQNRANSQQNNGGNNYADSFGNDLPFDNGDDDSSADLADDDLPF